MSENFTPIQTKKRLPQPICLTALCPSMDLVALGLGGNANANAKAAAAAASAASNNEEEEDASNDEKSVPIDAKIMACSTIIVYRTISWQKMFAISQSDLSNAASSMDIYQEEDGNGKGGVDNGVFETSLGSSSAEIGATHIIWSPDGRILGVALTNGCTLFYDIESCANPGVPPSPIFALPRPPAIVSSASLSPKKVSNAVYSSPRMTRSMTNARRKRLMRMSGKTPSHDMNLRTRSQDSPGGRNAIPKSPSHLQIKSMHWQRIRKKDTDEWPFRQYYLDRSNHFLPPCHYTMEGGGKSGGVDGINFNFGGGSGSTSRNLGSEISANDAVSNSHVPGGKTPLSILTVLGDFGLSLYLNGRYRIVSIDSSSTNGIDPSIDEDIAIRTSLAKEVVSTSDFHILASNQVQTYNPANPAQSTTYTLQMSMYHLPSILSDRYNLQFISYSYGAITNHLTTMKKCMDEVYNAWSAALRQLDMKFDQLSSLLVKYNVITQDQNQDPDKKVAGVRLVLLNYILGGHSSRSGDSSNAMDQFFTHPLMNDQLLIRMFRSLEANCAGVEGLLRKNILGPARSLVYDVGELYGLVKVMNADRAYEEDDGVEASVDGDLPTLMECETCLRLCEASEILYTISEQCVSQTVELRHRLDCMTKWIRATASQVKARGTAMDSVQRENARKRRIPEQILGKVSEFLSTPLKSSPGDLERKRGSTEGVLGILLSDYFAKDRVFLEKSRNPLQRRDNVHSDGFHSFVETPSLKAVFDVSGKICSELFNEPRQVLTKSVEMIDVVLEEGSNHVEKVVSAMHHRYNKRVESIDEEEGRTFNWTVFANTCKSMRDGCQLVQITAIPVGDEILSIETVNASSYQRPSFYQRTFLQIPCNCAVTGIKFYGDDGNSTLTSETSPSYKEGRQAIALLLKKNDGEAVSEEELWLVDYDEIPFRSIQINSEGTFVVRKYDASADECQILTSDEDMDDDDHAFAKSKLKLSPPFPSFLFFDKMSDINSCSKGEACAPKYLEYRHQ